MITDYTRLSGLDKTAILYKELGESLALTLIKGLSETDVRKIRARIREMEPEPISFLVKKTVLEQFYLAFITKKFSEDGSEDTKKPFEFLHNLEEERLIALLEVEEPRIIAVALAQETSERRMAVLNRLTPEAKGRALLEIGNLSSIPLEAVVSIATDLEEKSHFLPRAVEFSRGGGKDIADILGQMSSDDEEKYLEAINRESPDLAKEIKKYHLTFDDVFSFPDNIIRDLMNSVDLDIVAMALKGIPQETADRVIGNLPQKKQAMYEPVEGATPKRKIDDARGKIVSAAREMEKEGRFSLEDILGGGEMVD
tara:strand:- start:28305 stop:29240 length:936 start_codon:yes stop_codon:yes gene_type:complete